MKILMLDNYDSFTYNIVHIIRELAVDCTVVKNDQIHLSDVASFDKIIFSPGPGIPDEAGKMKEIIKTFAGKKSMLGICLGHQAIAEVFGGTLFNIPQVLHGVTSSIHTTQSDYLFAQMPTPFSGTHYHSWAVEKKDFPKDLDILAENTDGLIMALRHKQWDIRGLQFHPESIMTENGAQLLKNWVAH